MGYPTERTATSRSRAGTRLSDRLALFLPPGAVLGGVGSITSQAPPAQPYASRAPARLPSMDAVARARAMADAYRLRQAQALAEAAAKQAPRPPAVSPPPVKPSDLAGWAKGAAGLTRAVPAALAGLMAMWLLEQLARQLNPQITSTFVPGGGTWSWPDPAGYGAGSRVEICDGTSPDLGPYPGGGICGVIVSLDPDDPTGIDDQPDSPGDPNSTRTVRWWLGDVITPGLGPGYPAVNARYYSVPAEAAAPAPSKSPPYRPIQPDVAVDPPAYPNGLDPPIPYPLIPHVTPPGTERGNGPRRRSRPDKRARYRHAPPGRKIKEKKGKGIAGHLVRWIMQVTEGEDLIDALWDALPDEYKSKHVKGRSRATEKFLDLYRHINDIDVERGIENIILNMVKDAIIGSLEGAYDRIKGKPWNDPSRIYGQQKGLEFGEEYYREFDKFLNDLFEDYVRAMVPAI